MKTTITLNADRSFVAVSLPENRLAEETPHLVSGRGTWAVTGSHYEGWRLDLSFSDMSNRRDVTAKARFGGLLLVDRDWRGQPYLYDYLGDPDNAPIVYYERRGAR